MKTISILIVSFFCVASTAAKQPPPSAQTPDQQSTPRAASEVEQGVVKGRLIHKVNPVYPPDAKAAKIQGPVVLKATIEKDGSLKDVAAIAGDPALISSAVDAVRQWRYEPYRLNGEPVEVDTQVTVNFKLEAPMLYQRAVPAPAPDEYNAVPHRVRVSQGVSEALLKKKVQPSYPQDARSARIQGAVVLSAVIDYDGKINSLALVSGHPMLVPAALEAVKHWEYKPYFLQGAPVVVDTLITVNFVLQ